MSGTLALRSEIGCRAGPPWRPPCSPRAPPRRECQWDWLPAPQRTSRAARRPCLHPESTRRDDPACRRRPAPQRATCAARHIAALAHRMPAVCSHEVLAQTRRAVWLTRQHRVPPPARRMRNPHRTREPRRNVRPALHAAPAAPTPSARSCIWGAVQINTTC